MNIRQERIEKLPTIGQIINRHEKSAAFRPILGRARLRVAIAREIKRAGARRAHANGLGHGARRESGDGGPA